jgi:hypothetical protein
LFQRREIPLDSLSVRDDIRLGACQGFEDLLGVDLIVFVDQAVSKPGGRREPPGEFPVEDRQIRKL